MLHKKTNFMFIVIQYFCVIVFFVFISNHQVFAINPPKFNTDLEDDCSAYKNFCNYIKTLPIECSDFFEGYDFQNYVCFKAYGTGLLWIFKKDLTFFGIHDGKVYKGCDFTLKTKPCEMIDEYGVTKNIIMMESAEERYKIIKNDVSDYQERCGENSWYKKNCTRKIR